MSTTHQNARLQPVRRSLLDLRSLGVVGDVVVSRKTSPFNQIKALIIAQSSHSWSNFYQIKNHQSKIINRQLTLFLFLFLFLTSCADKPVDTPVPKPKEEQARLVGRIASIHKTPDFALIQSYGTWNIQTGAILATIGPDGRAANLKVTGEKTGQFAAADIQSGSLEIGDSVYTTLSSETAEAAKEESVTETTINTEAKELKPSDSEN